jgi:hypothetical protein
VEFGTLAYACRAWQDEVFVAVKLQYLEFSAFPATKVRSHSGQRSCIVTEGQVLNCSRLITGGGSEGGEAFDRLLPNIGK